jgi:hypothetical protein
MGCIPKVCIEYAGLIPLRSQRFHPLSG